MSVVLVPVANRPECARALKATLSLATRLQSNVIGCHIRPHRYSAVRLPLLPGDSDEEWLAAMKGRDPDDMSRAARKLFDEMASAAGFATGSKARRDGKPVAIWQERLGSPQRVMPIIGPVSDLVVVSRPAAKGGRIARMFMMQALLHSCRPALILPQNATRAPGRRIAIAWNQSPEASHAVAAALPVLRAADQVRVVSAGPENEPGPKANHVLRYLEHHGIAAESHNTRGHDVEAELLEDYRETRSDLLLMGAYARPRFSQLIFGGLTEYMLNRARIPILIHSR